MPTGVFERTAEARRNISKAQKGKKLSAEHKKKLSIKMFIKWDYINLYMNN